MARSTPRSPRPSAATLSEIRAAALSARISRVFSGPSRSSRTTERPRAPRSGSALSAHAAAAPAWLDQRSESPPQTSEPEWMQAQPRIILQRQLWKVKAQGLEGAATCPFCPDCSNASLEISGSRKLYAPIAAKCLHDKNVYAIMSLAATGGGHPGANTALPAPLAAQPAPQTRRPASTPARRPQTFRFGSPTTSAVKSVVRVGRIAGQRNEPAVSPATMRRWANSTSRAMGIEMMTTAASIRL